MKKIAYRAATKVGRLYPFKSGCGTFANAPIFRKLDVWHGEDDWATVFGGSAYVPSQDYVARAMKYVGDLDRKVSWVVDRCLNAGDTAVDVGANLGLVTLRMAAHVGPSGMVHAFEPQAWLRSYFRRTLTQNGLSQIILHDLALGATPGEMVLRVPPDNAGAASLVSDHGVEQTVQVETLDRMISDFRRSRIALMKIDVEGFEANVLKGGQTLLRDFPPHVILLEEHRSTNPDLPESLRLLSTYGYKIFGLPKALLSVKLVPVEDMAGQSAHDFIAIAPDCPAAIRAKLHIS